MVKESRFTASSQACRLAEPDTVLRNLQFADKHLIMEGDFLQTGPIHDKCAWRNVDILNPEELRRFREDQRRAEEELLISSTYWRTQFEQYRFRTNHRFKDDVAWHNILKVCSTGAMKSEAGQMAMKALRQRCCRQFTSGLKDGEGHDEADCDIAAVAERVHGTDERALALYPKWDHMKRPTSKLGCSGPFECSLSYQTIDLVSILF